MAACAAGAENEEGARACPHASRLSTQTAQCGAAARYPARTWSLTSSLISSYSRR
ncbi:hypothetical protein BURMUCF2_2507 [Burkholderia multivorans CF2]|nr:hypothetical protein BURMUCF2_2507 [Burkholderia multivorans CF2]